MRPGTRPQRSEVSPGGWDAVVASFFGSLCFSREEHSATQRFTYARHFKSREGAQGRGGRTRSRRASAIEVGLPGRADGAATAATMTLPPITPHTTTMQPAMPTFATHFRERIGGVHRKRNKLARRHLGAARLGVAKEHARDGNTQAGLRMR